MAIANTAVFGNHLDKDVDDIFFDEYTQGKSEVEAIAHMSQAPAGNHYTESELSGIGNLREIDEGDSIVFDIPIEGNKKTVYYSRFGLGFQITADMYNDDLTGNFKKMPRQLGKAAIYKKNAEFFDLFNSGFGTHTAWDAYYLFDASHVSLVDGSSKANEPASGSSLSETTLQAAFEYFYNLTDDQGRPIDITPFALIVPVDLMWTAGQLLGSDKIIGSANNDLNTVNPDNNIVEDSWMVHVSRYLTSTTAWFLLAKDHDLRFYWKEDAKLESADDFYTGNALFKTTMRFVCFGMDYKPMYGNPGA